MSKFERVLSDDEIDQIVNGLIWASGDSFGFGKDVATHIIQAMQDNLEEKEPAAWTSSKVFGHYATADKKSSSPEWFKDALDVPLYAHPVPCVSPTSDKTACVPENVESDKQELPPLPNPNCRSPNGIGYFDSFTKDQMIDYAKSAIDHYRATSNHIADKRKKVTPLAQRKIQTLLDKGEYRVIENATVLVNENGHAAIVNHGGAFYWVDNEALAREFDAAEAENTGEK